MAKGNVKLSKDNCAKLSAENTPLVTEGMQYLQKAVDLNPTYEEAMTYLSLMERRKADLDVRQQGRDQGRPAGL